MFEVRISGSAKLPLRCIRDQHRARISALGVIVVAVVALAGCAREPVEPTDSAGSTAEAAIPLATDLPAPTRFSTARAQFHLDALTRLTPRTPGSPADRGSRDYLERGFREIGLKIFDVSDRDAPEALDPSGDAPEGSEEDEDSARPRPAPRHLVAEIAGVSRDILLLVAAYPVVGEDAWIGDSGGALLLELARVLALETPAYTVWLALAETRTAETSNAPLEAAQARTSVVEAGESLARSLAAIEGLTRVRGVIVFDGSARPDLRIARDLRSHPVYREMFWASADELGFGGIFARDAGWASARSLHLGFRARGMDRVVALVDEARARAELTPIRHDGSASSASAASMEGLGRTTREAIDRIFHSLGRVDAFRTTGSRPVNPGQASPQIPEIPPSS